MTHKNKSSFLARLFAFGSKQHTPTAKVLPPLEGGFVPCAEPYTPPPARLKLPRRYETNPDVVDAAVLVALDILNSPATHRVMSVSPETGTKSYEYWNDDVREGWTLKLTRPHTASELYHAWLAVSPRGVLCKIPPGIQAMRLDAAEFEDDQRRLFPAPSKAGAEFIADAASNEPQA